MVPGFFRNRTGFAAIAAAPATLIFASPALAQGITPSGLIGVAPLAIVLGAGAFVLIATAVVRRALREGRRQTRKAAEQVAALRALLDEYEGLLSGAREATIVWNERVSGPRILGQAAALLPAGRRPEAILDFSLWLMDEDAERLFTALEALRVRGQALELTLKARDGRTIRANGWVLGGGAALRLRPAQQTVADIPEDRDASAKSVLALINEPAFLLDAQGKLLFANLAYQSLAKALGKPGREIKPSALAEAAQRSIMEIPLASGSAGYLKPRPEPKPVVTDNLSHLNSIVDALTTPIAIFGPDRALIQSNRAYQQLWQLDPAWLKPGLDERAILDRLRTNGMLPQEPDYQAWRARHLQSYQLTTPRENEPWHLPDGRTIQVISAPAGPQGGVIYVFEDMTDQLKLKSEYRTMIDVQRSTLNALSEGVAVFGTNGRLTISNPRLSTLWKLPTNLLETKPHIDEILDAVGKALPEEGAKIWRDLKRGIVDLNPTRTDQKGRIARGDGRLIDYAITRLPDGQSLMSFVDVTEIANYQRVLKERNEALITADRLKDAFVQNVSYELRSPLTNIIGFADLLASGSVGALNDKQKSYTEYIRASSVTLGVLIDNILDLANVDAGIAEMKLEDQDVSALVEKARAGLVATFPEIDGQKTLNLVLNVPPNLPPLHADGTRIVQVLYNLLSTSARFSEPGGMVRLSVSHLGDKMQFIIEDEGAQTSEEMRAAIMEQVDQTIAGRQRAAALGLAIVRTFVNLHGGFITVEKRDPRGSRVIVTLPRMQRLAGAAE